MSSAEESSACDPSEHVFIELDATAMLCLPSGECLRPDAASCTTLTSALYACIGEEDVLKRRVMVRDAAPSPSPPELSDQFIFIFVFIFCSSRS